MLQDIFHGAPMTTLNLYGSDPKKTPRGRAGGGRTGSGRPGRRDLDVRGPSKNVSDASLHAFDVDLLMYAM